MVIKPCGIQWFSMEQKRRFFDLLVGLGYKHIEIAFPCASATEYSFTRSLIETPGAVPEDVTLQVMTPCRKETLQKAVDSLRGAKKAILFTWISISDNFRDTILELSEEECLQRAYDCTAFARSITLDNPSAQDTQWTFGFGLEDFSNSRPEASVRLGETVKAAWRPTQSNPLVLGLAASVEGATPNVFADQVEYFSTHISEREKISLSVHPHNDRGCAVAAAELACLAGADKVEGCLFGNGERAGNVDLVTLALNLYTQGIDPGIDFSDLRTVSAIVEDIIKIPVHPRAPYAGEYYFLALSGAHQDAICKGLRRRGEGRLVVGKGVGDYKRREKVWRVPYLPMDPADVGVSQDSVIGINSQSGKSGVLWMLQLKLGLKPPRELAMVFSKTVKARSAELSRELAAMEMCDIFLDMYYDSRLDGPAQLCHSRDHNVISIDLGDIEGLVCEGPEISVVGSAAANLSQALSVDVTCVSATSHHIDSMKEVVAYVQCVVAGSEREQWGVGFGEYSRRAYISAIMSAVTKSNVFYLLQPDAPANGLHQATPIERRDGAINHIRNGERNNINGFGDGLNGACKGLDGSAMVLMESAVQTELGKCGSAKVRHRNGETPSLT